MKFVLNHGNATVKDIRYELSDSGIVYLFCRKISLLNKSVILFKKGEKEFIDTISSSLRILCCDYNKGKNVSLINTLFPDMKFSKINTDSGFSERLFSKTELLLSLDDWLDQLVVSLNNTDDTNKETSLKITIKDIIRSSCDKYGGAHIDAKLKKEDYLSIRLANAMLIYIGGHIADVSYDLVDKNLNHLLNNKSDKDKFGNIYTDIVHRIYDPKFDVELLK